MVRKSGTFRCPDCPETFSRPNGLSRHRSSAHGVVSPTAAKKGTAGPKPRGGARTSRAATGAAPNGTGRYAETIASLERDAAALEIQAKAARDAAAALRKLA